MSPADPGAPRASPDEPEPPFGAAANAHEVAAGASADAPEVPAGSPAARHRGVAFDLDGVVYHGSDPVPAAPGTLARLREARIPFLFLTNNSARTPDRVAERLAGMGIEALPRDVLTSAQATAELLSREGAAGRTVFVIGETGICRALEQAGLRLEDEPESTDYVVIGWDRGVDYAKLRRAAILVQRGARLIATNADASYPGPDGLWPGAGALLSAVTAATGATPTVVGKPARPMFDAARAHLGLGEPATGDDTHRTHRTHRAGGSSAADGPRATRGTPLIVGDRLDTDIAGADGAGWDSLLVFTGVTRPADLLGAQELPTYIGPDIAAVLAGRVPGRFRPARTDDVPDIAAVLADAGLPLAGVDERVESTMVCDDPDGGGLAATASLQHLGTDGLLRSVAVAEGRRGSGLGTLAVASAVAAARRAGVRDIGLFTEDAAGFFETLGFAPVGRDALPDGVRRSDQAGECAGATAMLLAAGG